MNALYTHLGYNYCPWDCVEEDNIKIYHECYKDGKRVNMPSAFYNHSPYETMTCNEFVGHVQSLEVFIQG